DSYLATQKTVKDKYAVKSIEKKPSFYELNIKPHVSASSNFAKATPSTISKEMRPHLKPMAAALSIFVLIGGSILGFAKWWQSSDAEIKSDEIDIVHVQKPPSSTPMPSPTPPPLQVKTTPEILQSDDGTHLPPKDIQKSLLGNFGYKSEFVHKDMRASFEKLLRENGSGEYQVVSYFGNRTPWNDADERRGATIRVMKSIGRELGIEIKIAPSTKKNPGVQYTTEHDKQRGIFLFREGNEKLSPATKVQKSSTVSINKNSVSKKKTSNAETRPAQKQKRAPVNNKTSELVLRWNAKDTRNENLTPDLERELENFLQKHKNQCTENVIVFKPAFNGSRTSISRHAYVAERIRKTFPKAKIIGDATIKKLPGDVVVQCTPQRANDVKSPKPKTKTTKEKVKASIVGGEPPPLDKELGFFTRKANALRDLLIRAPMDHEGLINPLSNATQEPESISLLEHFKEIFSKKVQTLDLSEGRKIAKTEADKKNYYQSGFFGKRTYDESLSITPVYNTASEKQAGFLSSLMRKFTRAAMSNYEAQKRTNILNWQGRNKTYFADKMDEGSVLKLAA
ncbi:MAG: hypothetical protein ACT4OY_02395, partial [Alphaproteobacteria bacterium]